MLTDCRLSRLEHTVSALVDQLGANAAPRWMSSDASHNRPLSAQRELYAPSAVPSAAPVLAIRDIATDLPCPLLSFLWLFR